MEHTRDGQQPFEEQPKEGESEARSLARNFSLQGKLNALTNILLSKGSIFDKRSKGPSFIFAGQSIHRPHYTVFYRRDQPDPSICQEPLPMIGYLNYTNVSGTRWHKFQPRHHSGDDDSTASQLSKKKLARVTPKEWKEDPYFVCVLLSLAQLQERHLKPPRPISHTVSAPCASKLSTISSFVSLTHTPKSRLLIASPMDRESIHLYEAQFTSDFLGMLDNPAIATMPANFPTIKRKQISFRPFETFQERILADLSVQSIPPHVSNKDDNAINKNAKRAHKQEDDERRKRGRTS
ncbi:hypothetical protein PITC_021420 [Penicillium italicum]|uniref:Uncharacterized protein n=1 Tax=Penicillium italicum TaxID=40296 RepID=A0A0A2KGB5_PENIT|nr:hypothetical protein PITC_021420 [Penicillium italicum]